MDNGYRLEMKSWGWLHAWTSLLPSESLMFPTQGHLILSWSRSSLESNPRWLIIITEHSAYSAQALFCLICTVWTVEGPKRIQCQFLWNGNSLLNGWDRQLRVACSFCHQLLIFSYRSPELSGTKGWVGWVWSHLCCVHPLSYNISKWRTGDGPAAIPSIWVSRSQSFPTDGESKSALLNSTQDSPWFHFESKDTLETSLLMRQLVRCPWNLPVFDSPTVDLSDEIRQMEFTSHFGVNWMIRVFCKPEISFIAISILMKTWRPGWNKPLICFRVGEDRIMFLAAPQPLPWSLPPILWSQPIQPWQVGKSQWSG